MTTQEFDNRTIDTDSPQSGRTRLFAKAAGLFMRRHGEDPKRVLVESDLAPLATLAAIDDATDPASTQAAVNLVLARLRSLALIATAPSEGVAATATLTSTGTALTDADTVTIGDRVYTYKTVLTGAADEVLIGAATASLTNLKSAVNGTAGAGTTYGTGTVAHADVTAGTLTGTTVLDFEASTPGAAGNSIAKAETSTNLSWDAGETFSGGVDAS